MRFERAKVVGRNLLAIDRLPDCGTGILFAVDLGSCEARATESGKHEDPLSLKEVDCGLPRAHLATKCHDSLGGCSG